MRLGVYLSSLTKPELAELEEQLNLTDDEAPVFLALSKGRSKTRIAGDYSISVGTVSNRIKSITEKVKRIKKVVKIK